MKLVYLGIGSALIIAIGGHFALRDEPLKPAVKVWLDNPLPKLDMQQSVLPDLMTMTAEGVEDRDKSVLKLVNDAEKAPMLRFHIIDWPKIDELDNYVDKKWICSLDVERCMEFYQTVHKKFNYQLRQLQYLTFDYLDMAERTNFYTPISTFVNIESEPLRVLNRLIGYEILYDFMEGKVQDAHYKLAMLVKLDRKIITQSQFILWRRRSDDNIHEIYLPLIKYLAAHEQQELLKVRALFFSLNASELHQNQHYRRSFEEHVKNLEYYIGEPVNSSPLTNYSIHFMYKQNETLNGLHQVYSDRMVPTGINKKEYGVFAEETREFWHSKSTENYWLSLLKNVRNLHGFSTIKKAESEYTANLGMTMDLDVKYALLRHRIDKLIAESNDEEFDDTLYVPPYDGSPIYRVEDVYCFKMQTEVCL
ncbi:MAG: hypothetical protein ACPGR2_03850 [Psychrobium sp.]